MTDPRDRRGVRHCLTAILCLSVVGVLAGCRTLEAMREHVADLEPADLGDLDLEEGRALPSESTIRRVLERVNADDLDARLSSWLRTRVGAIGGRRVIAVEDETMRGARTGSNPAPHLLAAPGRAAGTALTQRRVADKSNEIPALRDLLAPLDLGGAVAGADAMHTQTGTAEWIRSRGAHYVLTVKNMPAGPETGPGETALEGRALHLRPRRLPRAQSAAHRPGRRGPRPGRLPRRRPGDPDPPHQNRQGEEAHRGGPPDLLPPPDRRPARGRRLLGPRPLGHGGAP